MADEKDKATGKAEPEIVKYAVLKNCIVDCLSRGKRFFAAPGDVVHLERLRPDQNRGGQLRLVEEARPDKGPRKPATSKPATGTDN